MTTNNHDFDYFTICRLSFTKLHCPICSANTAKNIIFEYMGVTLNKNFITAFHKETRLKSKSFRLQSASIIKVK